MVAPPVLSTLRLLVSQPSAKNVLVASDLLVGIGERVDHRADAFCQHERRPEVAVAVGVRDAVVLQTAYRIGCSVWALDVRAD